MDRYTLMDGTLQSCKNCSRKDCDINHCKKAKNAFMMLSKYELLDMTPDELSKVKHEKETAEKICAMSLEEAGSLVVLKESLNEVHKNDLKDVKELKILD